MTRVLILVLALSGCATERIPVERATVSAQVLNDIPWPWCTKFELLKCPMMVHDGDVFMLPIGARVGEAEGW